MIVDTYTHVWESPIQLGMPPVAEGGSANDIPSAVIPEHRAACECVDRAIVVGFRSQYLDAEMPNRFVAEYVADHPQKLIGFGGIDPGQPAEALNAISESTDLGLKGVAIAPSAQDFHPASSGAYKVYDRLTELKLPVLVHQGVIFLPKSKLEYARPMLLDEVGRDFPGLKVVIAHLGAPWIDETILLLAKHTNFFADVSSLLSHPLKAYNALLTAQQHGVMHKLLFGSGFPFSTPAKAIEALYSINQICRGTNLPLIPREQLRGIVERPTLELLGIPDPVPSSPTAQPAALLAETDEV